MSTINLASVPTHPKRLRTALIALAALEGAFALLQSLKLIAPDVQIANGHFAVLVTTTKLIATPILAVAALVFAARDRLPEAIIALAAILLMMSASEALSAQFTVITLILLSVVRPLTAVFAILLAIRGIRLGLAAALVASMWILWFWVTFLSEFLPFVLGVMIYGA